MINTEGMIGSWDWDITHHKLHTTNFGKILGHSDAEINQIIDTSTLDLSQTIHPEDFPIVRRAIITHLTSRTDHFETEYRMLHQDGYWVWIHDLGQVVARNSKTHRAERMIGIRRNMDAEKAAADSKNLSAMLFQNVEQGIFILDNQFRVQNTNPYFEKISGFSNEEMVGTRFMSRNRSFNKRVVQEALKVSQLLESTGEFEGEFFTQRKNGEEYLAWLHLNAVYDDQNRKTHYIGLIGDLTERRKNEQSLSYLANYDPLTNLPNRNFFKDHLHQFINQCTENNNEFSLLLLNLDRFRLLNDLLGANGADQLLKQVAQRISTLEYRTRITARIGSDDFAILLEISEDNQQELDEFSQKLLQLFDASFMIDSQEITVTASIGIAIFPEHGKQVDALLSSAENALKNAKRMGGNTLYFAGIKRETLPSERLSFENDLRKAMTHSQFVVYYQAKLNAQSQQIVGFEALVRWLHPEKGLIPPIQFISLAEEIGIISSLGEFVLDQACAQIRTWADAGFGYLVVSVNVSAQQLQRSNFVATLDRVLKKHQINPSQLELEITESLLMDEREKVLAILQEIRSRQVTIALDDFGTGYSSLSYLGHYPIDVIKIDRSFVIQMMSNPEQKVIVLAILAMSHALDMDVVAEGVETIEQARFLRDEGCELLQGYLMSKPIPALEATQLLTKALTQPILVI